MRNLNTTLFLLFVLGLLGAVSAWPNFNVPNFHVNRAELMVGALGAMSCATFFSWNLLRSAREYQPEVPAIGSDEEVFAEDVSITPAPLALPLPTPTATTGGTPTTTTITQTELLSSTTREPRSYYTVFELDPPERATLFRGSPSVPKVVVVELSDNSTIVSAEIVLRLADVDDKFQDFTYLSPTKSTSPVTAPTGYTGATPGINIPTPDSTDLNTTSSRWGLPSFIIHGLQDNRLKPFVESARRKLNFFWGLRNTIFGPLIRLLPVRPEMLGFILMGVRLVSLWFPGMTRRRRRGSVLQGLGWFRNPQLATEAAPEAGPPQIEPSMADAAEEAEAVVQTVESSNLVAEPQHHNCGHQEEEQDSDREYVDCVDGLMPAVQQEQVRLSGFIMRPLPPPSRTTSPPTEAPASTSGTAAVPTDVPPRSSEQPASTLETPSQPSAEPPKLPEFPSTRSTAPIAEHALRRRLPILRLRERKRASRLLAARVDEDEDEDMRPDEVVSSKSLRDKYRPAPAGPSAPAPAPLSTKSSGAADDTVPVPVLDKVAVIPSSADEQPAAQPKAVSPKTGAQLPERKVQKPETPASNISESAPQATVSPIVPPPSPIRSSDTAPPKRQLTKAELKDEQFPRALQDAEIKRAKAKSTTTSIPEPKLNEASRKVRVGLLQSRFQEQCGVENLDSAQVRRFLDYFGWDGVNHIPATAIYQQWIEFQAYEENAAAERGQDVVNAPTGSSTEAESSRAVRNIETATETAQATEPQSSNVTSPLNASSAQPSLPQEDVGTATQTAQASHATAEPQSGDVAPPPTQINSAQRSLLRDTLRNRLKKSFGVQDTESKKVEEFLDIFGWHKLSLENLNEVCEAWFAWEAEQTAKAAPTLTNLAAPEPVVASEGEETVPSPHEAAPTDSTSKTESSENVQTSSISDQSPDTSAEQQPVEIESSDVPPAQPETTDPHYRASLVTYLQSEIRDKLAVDNVNEDYLHAYLDWFGWENVGKDNYLHVSKSFLDAVAAAASAGPEATSTSTETVADGDDGTTANRHSEPGKAEETLPPTSHTEGDGDDDNDDSDNGSPPPPSSGAVVAETSSTEAKPTEESNSTAAPSGEDNGSGNEGPSTRSTVPAPVFSGFQFNVQSQLPERPVYQVSDEDRIFRLIPDTVGASTPRRSALRNRERDADEVPSRLGHLGRARIAVNDDGSPVAQTRRFRTQEPPARVQRAYHMEIDGEGREATGAPAPAPAPVPVPAPVPAPTRPAVAQSFPSAPEFAPEMEGVEKQDVHEARDGVEKVDLHEEMEGIEKPDLDEEMDDVETDKVSQLEQSTMLHRQPMPYVSPYNVVPPPSELPVQDQQMTTVDEPSATPHQQSVQYVSPYNVVPASSEPLVQDQQMTMAEEQGISNAAPFDFVTLSQADSHQAQPSQFNLPGLPTFGTTEWNNLEAIDQQDRQRQQEPQHQPIVLQGQDWANPEDFFSAMGLSPNATGAGVGLDLAGEMPEIRSLLDSLLPGGRTEYDPHDPHAGMEGVEMGAGAEEAQYPQRASQVAPTPMQPATGDLPYGDPSEYAVGQQNAPDIVHEQSDVAREAPASTSEPEMTAWDRARLRANMQSTGSGSPQNTANPQSVFAYTGEQAVPTNSIDELREWGVWGDRVKKVYNGHVQRKTLRPRGRLAAQQTTPAQANPFQSLLQPQSNTIVNPQDIHIPPELAAALQRRHNQTQGLGTSQPTQQPAHPQEGHTDGGIQNERNAEDDSFSDISDLNEEEKSQLPAYLQVSGAPNEQPHHDEENDDHDNLSDVPDLDEDERRRILAQLQGLGSPSAENPQHGEDSIEGGLSPSDHNSHRDDISFDDSVEKYLYDSPEEEAMKRDVEEYSRTS
ncbi:hypothetical protein A1O7_03250 [Cladophialophora yegresii CBS 114405]|uniref:Uncharacterized protein n=1 Tax=Cladophialophora yegresii CBS 114405 TaxID=1182544 RepID=W9WCS2_9EURO|nr:uncharacterized protein A1O7_03250 [Cladophialophora yegresii CBS 114405]EXJ62810.1 hypothetical protein A1O7_03250 [Cladophialophora yegresii CBS 114405]